ncbi:AAA family ATPase [Xenorhabdus bovienii]|uniref:AAA family ATPase n=1 Tax=Xenorhabdus bovienii TaxID=40576 RepID=UPI0008FFC94A|nr:AAA family ATPase [Xenorhabdus bovienii]
MRITQISLTNFRSFKETQTIDIAPVTLLFGLNSVGKSSVLMALAYVRQILKHGYCNPQKLDSLGKKTIGGLMAMSKRANPLFIWMKVVLPSPCLSCTGVQKKGYGASVHTIGTRKVV